MVYYNLDENMQNDRFPATEETKKDQVFSEEFLRNVNRSRNFIFPKFYMTLFQ